MSRDYNDPRYIKWRNQVFRRDKYKCSFPGCCSHGKLNAHHIKRYANFPALRFDPNNGISLCEEHHKQTFGKEEEYEALFMRIVADRRIGQKNSSIDTLRIKYGRE